MALQAELYDIDKGQHGAEWICGSYQCRNFEGWFQQREMGEGNWQFVIIGFGINDCSVYRVNQSGALYEQVVPIDEQDRITIGRRKYGRDNWHH